MNRERKTNIKVLYLPEKEIKLYIMSEFSQFCIVVFS